MLRPTRYSSWWMDVRGVASIDTYLEYHRWSVCNVLFVFPDGMDWGHGIRSRTITSVIVYINVQKFTVCRLFIQTEHCQNPLPPLQEFKSQARLTAECLRFYYTAMSYASHNFILLCSYVRDIGLSQAQQVIVKLLSPGKKNFLAPETEPPKPIRGINHSPNAIRQRHSQLQAHNDQLTPHQFQIHPTPSLPLTPPSTSSPSSPPPHTSLHFHLHSVSTALFLRTEVGVPTKRHIHLRIIILLIRIPIPEYHFTIPRQNTAIKPC